MSRLNFGLIGYPISHSQSPQLFKAHSPLRAIGDYHLFPIENLDALHGVIERYQPRGLNITSPYKELILQDKSLPLHIDPVVECIRAANVLTLSYDNAGNLKEVKADNSDTDGFRESLRPLLHSEDKLALILGTGGAARAVALALEDLGFGQDDYRFISRDISSVSPALIHFLGGYCNPIESYDILEVALRHASIVINASPLGLAGSDAPNIPYHLLNENHLCYDLNYSIHGDTPFLKAASPYTSRLKDGLEMLRLQAQRSWQIWAKAIKQ